MSQTVVGIFDTAAQAQNAAQQLQAAGFNLDHVDVSTNNAQSTAATGATSASSNSSSSGDGIGNFFSNLFGGDDYEDTHRYSHVARSTGSIVTVHAHSAENARRAAEIMDAAGAIDVEDRASQSGYQSTGRAAYADASTATNTEGTQSAQVIEENLQVGKRVEQTGGARLRSRIVERPVEASVRLREEHVTVERHPVNRPATEADFNTFKEGTIEVTESAERAVVGKEARVVEEVSLGKEVTEREETIHDTVRKTEVDIERLDGTTGTTGTTGTAYDTDDTTTRR
ncbi:YsnF/AvaK domain-containing protein [Hymenobacter sp.]|jgi:uncharacterized protein (TIGR02271 family)|uniref:YsnF/AvaK domain-containing protein n=1 Tax=Hymenobacter sp. TaxID=1898978 RepID=UPI002EDA76F7